MSKHHVRPPLLGELESAVMNYFWAGGDGEARSVHLAVGLSRGITLSTIQSTLKRLFEKKLLERVKVSHAHVYRMRVTREKFHSDLIGELFGELTDDVAAMAVAAFVDLAERAGPEHLERLESLVAERRRANEKAGRK